MANQLKITYKVFLEAEDVKETKILSCRNFVQNFFNNCGNAYFKNVEIDDESDLEEFMLRLYIDRTIEEETCSSPEDAQSFLSNMAEFLDKLAEAQPFLEMDGEFSINYQDVCETYRFVSNAYDDFCEILDA